MENELEPGAPVALLRWPAQRTERAALAAAQRPRVLLVGRDTDPPAEWDPLEDWVREPVDGGELSARQATVLRRAQRLARRPRFDADGLLWSGDRWVHLGDAQRALVAPVVERFGRLVATDELVAALDAAGVSSHQEARRALGLRVRGRLAELDLALHTIKGRGLLLSFDDEQPAVAGAPLASGSSTGDDSASSARRGADEMIT